MRVPIEFEHTPGSLKELICNGCGAGNATIDFVPDTIYGLSISQACNVHDFEYWWHNSEYSREKADENFIYNLNYLIDIEGGWMKYVRKARAWLYFKAVRYWGATAFADKSQIEDDRYREQASILRNKYRLAMQSFLGQRAFHRGKTSIFEFFNSDDMKELQSLMAMS